MDVSDHTARRPWLGIIADDFTGATDVAGYLAAEGVDVVQFFGVPADGWVGIEADCIIVALKSRSVDPVRAVQESLAALVWLQDAGVGHVYFKYCSTFDSTPTGNIGPVLDALSEALNAESVLVAPSAPRNGRTVYRSRLFVWDQLLAESPMKDHPLNPMWHSDLRELLRAQSRRSVGALQWGDLRAIADGTATDAGPPLPVGATHIVADAVTEDDLRALGRIALQHPLSSGSAGLAAGMAQVWMVGRERAGSPVVLPQGPTAVLAGSCSAATREQVVRFQADHPSFFIDPRAIARGEGVVDRAVAFARAAVGSEVPLIYSTAEPAEISAIQAELGVERSAHLVETAMGAVAVALVDAGVRRLVIAGGETAGAAVSRLSVEGIRIGEEVDPGVPWTVTLGDPSIGLLLKSGNFGAPDFFAKAAAWR